MLATNEDYQIVATECEESVAMLFFEKSGEVDVEVHINEQAREKFRSLWAAGVYEKNMKKIIIPYFAARLDAGFIPVYGFQTELPAKPQLVSRKF